jgi:GNAT superfamily N-acetyltransferase
MLRTDGPAVARLLNAAYGVDGVPAGIAPRLVGAPISDALVERWRRRCAGAWVTDAPGFGPIGVVFAVIAPDAGWFAGLAVNAAFRGVGTGTALTDTALAFLRDARCPQIGIESSPHGLDALGLYARRGLRPVDVTVRLQVAVAEFAPPDGVSPFRRDPPDATGWQEDGAVFPRAAEHVAAVPFSDTAFVLHAHDVIPGLLLCDPAPVAPPAGGALEVRLAWAGGSDHIASLLAGLRASAMDARALGLRCIEIDVPLRDGAVISALRRAGFEPVATMLRLSDDPEAYRAHSAIAPLAGRWSL